MPLAAPARKRPSKPSLRVIGAESSTQAVAGVLRSLRARVVCDPWSVLDEPSARDALAWVLVDLETGTSLRDALKTHVGGRTQNAPPIFAVVTEATKSSIIRGIYSAGAAGVFLWPHESLLLPRYLAEILAIRQVHGKARHADVAVSRVVRSRLRMVPGVDRKPRVSVHDGFVTLTGATSTLATKHRIEEVVASVAGVRGLDASRLTVLPPPVTDRALRTKVAGLLDAMPTVDRRTLAVSIDGGEVVLGGSVESKGALERLKQRIAQLSGVRAIESHVVPSRKQAQQDGHVAARLRSLVGDLFPEQSDVRLSYFGGVAVLQGTVDRLQAARAIAAFLDEHPAVNRTVNKITVDG
jgi:osmotically-inducible protein OsmY